MKINKLLLATVCLMLFTSCNKVIEKVPPNILWIVVEDMSSHFGYQGEALVTTPHINQLANHGVVFNNAYVSAPVCSASRSAFITGMYQTSIGAHHHRSSRGKELVNKYSDRLFAYALSLCFDHSIASDIVQQVFISFYEFRYKLNPKYSIESFLYKSTYNKFITEHHKNKS